MKLSESLLDYVTFANIFLAIVTLISYKIVAQIVYYRFFSPLRVFPGPFWGSVTRLWLGWHCWRQTELQVVKKLHEKYGPVLRLTPTLLLVSDSAKMPEIYHRQANKTDHYVTGSCGTVEAVFNMKEHKAHARFRKVAAGPYSFSNIKKMEGLIDTRMEEWADSIASRFVKSGEAFDLCDWAVFMAYDIVSEIGFGKPFGFVPAGTDIGGLIQGFHDGMTAFGLMARFHPFVTWIKTTPLASMFIATPEDDSGIGVLMRYRDKLFNERVEDTKAGKTGDRVDLLQTFIDAREDDGQPLSADYIKAEILLVLLAGADTTGTTFQAMFYYIMSTPRVYSRMITEVDTATKAGKLSLPVPQYDEVVENCPYYVACVRESMRLCPAAPNIFPRFVSAPGIDLFGKFAPPGTEITCNPYFLHRDKNLYGEDAEEFKPERWLENEKRTRELLKYNFAFGYGPRICLGKDIALVELFKGPLHFFRMFDAELVDEKKRGQFVVHGGVGFWEDMRVTVKRRSVAK
ncbi:putative cytochrome P450 [Microthyrium microscopicum]|uniref:Putative cytochrome P450 n=1 Tax=Microthyrium microscopicum TaxID=703497 RepID=A0A6A6U334_9PEZI|nr:putative cytochrome P450 [Microthyrium microscopicum]